jgi:hypothetical protein
MLRRQKEPPTAWLVAEGGACVIDTGNECACQQIHSTFCRLAKLKTPGVEQPQGGNGFGGTRNSCGTSSHSGSPRSSSATTTRAAWPLSQKRTRERGRSREESRTLRGCAATSVKILNTFLPENAIGLRRVIHHIFLAEARHG